jgi:glycosyltransferase involved in cell wall biosynthesis
VPSDNDCVTGAPRKQALSTLHFPRRAAWKACVQTIDCARMSRRGVVGRLVRESKHYPAIVLNGSGSPLDELTAGILIGRRRWPPQIMYADCVWGLGGFADRLIVRAALRLLDGPHVHYCVHSHAQRDLFPELWGVDPERVHVTPYYYTLSEEELSLPSEQDGTIFAGGDSHRDYGPLIEAARRIDAPVVLATGRLTGEERGGLPGNVHAPGRVPHAQYVDMMRRASVIVVALAARDDRSAGEQTYLNAMALGKPVIVVDTMGVREYVSDGETGLVVPPRDPAALVEALTWVLDPSNRAAVGAMTKRARNVAVGSYGPNQYVAGLLGALEEVLAGAGIRLEGVPERPVPAATR